MTSTGKKPTITSAQVALLTYLSDAPEGYAACERVCHPNTAAALERRGLLTIEDGDGKFRPWFDCRITDAGRKALSSAEQVQGKVPGMNKRPTP